MQCVNCGRPLRANETICPNCGEPVLAGAAIARAAEGANAWPPADDAWSGDPADPYAPTVFGSPAPDRSGRATPTFAAGNAYPSFSALGDHNAPTMAARPYDPPTWDHTRYAAARRRSPALTPRTWLYGALAAVAVLGLIGLLFVGALTAAGVRLPIPTLGFTSPAPASTRGPGPSATHAPAPTATTASACPLPAVDPAAARMLGSIQLATGVRDLEHHDLRPLDNVTTFSVGQDWFVTMVVQTNEAGSISTTICTDGNDTTTVRDVARGLRNARAAFFLGADQPVPLGPSDVGPGSVVIRWNGAVAAVLPFTVVPAGNP
jgi:hypothetical protein